MATISSGRALAHGLPVSTIAILFAVTLYGGELAAQPASTVSGTVTTANNTAIPQARVRLVGTTRAAVTHADGTFELDDVRPGPGTIQITMIGYSPKTVAIVMTPGETLNLKLSLEPLQLETVTVSANPDSFGGMGGFQERKARGTGRYFTHEEIKLMQPRQVTDVLRRVPGMQIQFGGAAFGGGTQTARAGRSAA